MSACCVTASTRRGCRPARIRACSAGGPSATSRPRRRSPRRWWRMALSWRKARLDDAALLWRWANDAETRRNAFDPAPIPYADHVGWLERRLASAATRLLVFSDEAGPVGQVRFDVDDGVAEIDIAI